MARLLAVAILCAATLAGARAETQRERWNEPGEGFRIIDNIYYVGAHGISSFLIATPAGDFLIDGALQESAPQIEQHIKDLGFKLSDVKYLLTTHAHYDHTGGLAQLKRDTGASFFASEGDRSALEGGFYLGYEGRHEFDAPPIKVDRTVTDGERLTLGATTLTAVLTPGHARGCTSWQTTAHEGGKIYNVFIFCSATVAANRLVGPPQYPGIVADYEQTFAKTKAMHVDVFLAPHAEFYDLWGKRAKQKAGVQPNPFVDPGEFPKFIAAAERDFYRQLAAQKAALKAKAP